MQKEVVYYRRTIIFLTLAIGGYCLAMLGLLIDWLNLTEQSYFLFRTALLAEICALILIALAMNVGFPSDLTKILSLCLVGAGGMLIMIEIQNLQWAFTRPFIGLAIIICVALPLCVSVYLWGSKK